MGEIGCARSDFLASGMGIILLAIILLIAEKARRYESMDRIGIQLLTTDPRQAGTG
jgi:hypothetical protein